MKKQLSSVLAIVLGVSLLTGCGGGQHARTVLPQSGTGVQSAQSSAGASNLLASSSPSGTVDVLSNIKNKYASAAADSENEFNEPMYNLASDYVFKFDCNEDALRSVYYDAFGVYTTIDYENPDKYIRNCATCTLENGQLVVEPSVVDKFYDIAESTITADTDTYGAWKTESDGTWGNLNKLYLIQKYDLETGAKLAKPIITPFSIHHEIESTTVKQKIDSNNNYYLEWSPVTGASAYLVYQIIDESFYLVNKTTDTQVSSDNFQGQLNSDKWSDIVNQELQENGYDITTIEKIVMNSDLHKNKDSKFAVVAVKNGKTSGISNIVDSNELADRLPYEIADDNIEVTINTVNDLPTYVTMTTVNDKTMQMIINYHGCTAKYENDDSTTYYLYPSVYRTDLSPFKITVHGMPYSEFKAKAQAVADRQDKITATMPTEQTDADVNVSNVPNEEEETGHTEQIIQETGIQPPAPSEPATPSQPAAPDQPGTGSSEEPETPDEPGTGASEEPQTPDEPGIGTSEEPQTPDEPGTGTSEEPQTPEEPATPGQTTGSADDGTTSELFAEVANVINTNVNLLQQQSGVAIDNIVFAESPLEEWIAYCLLARSEYIPVPYSEFPEGADVEGTASKILSIYRQNPTSGMINDVAYSYDYETFIVSYADDTMDRLNKTVEELKKAQEVADSVTGGLSSEYDKVVALNDYFCANASYDESSMSTDVDMNSLTQSFIDAHTPYGILCNDFGVCESYSEAMALTGRLSGLNVIIETGDLYGAGGHEWNRVNIDGNWCILDITNNDSDVVPNGLCNITDSMATQLLIPDHQAYLFDATASNDSYEYYHMNNNYAESVTDLASKLKAQLDDSDAAYVRVGSGITEDDIVATAKQLYGEGYPLNEVYSMFNVVVFSK